MIETILIAGLRSLLVAAVTGLALSAFRVRDPVFRQTCWRLVLVAMIAMPFLTFVLPPVELPLLPPAPTPTISSTSGLLSPTVPRSPGPSPLPMLPLAYGLIAIAFSVRWAAGYLLGRRLVRSASPVTIEPPDPQPGVWCLESDRVSVPMTFGWIRPAILLPSTFRSWSVRKLRAVLAHEAAHIRRGDFATASLAAFGKAVFWFHPLAWWLEWRLGTLAEQAADDAAAERNPQAYAGILVNIARDAQAGRVRGLAVAGRRGLESRVTRLLDPEYKQMQTPRRQIVLMVSVLIALSGLCASIAVTEASSPSEPAASTGNFWQREEVVEAATEASEGEVEADEAPSTREEPRSGSPAQESQDPERPAQPPVDAGLGRGIGRIQVTTRSGTNRYQGTVRWDVRDPAQNARSWAENRDLNGPPTPSPEGEQQDELSHAFFYQLWDANIAAGGLPTSPEGSGRHAETRQSSAPEPARTIQEIQEALRAATERPLAQGQEQPARPQAPPDEARQEEAPEEESAPVYRLGNEVRPPTARERVDPEYTQEAREARIQGTVVVDAIVLRDGTIEVIGVAKGLDPGLDESAVEALSQWKFNPGTRNGEPVDVRLQIEINFTLR